MTQMKEHTCVKCLQTASVSPLLSVMSDLIRGRQLYSWAQHLLSLMEQSR